MGRRPAGRPIGRPAQPGGAAAPSAAPGRRGWFVQTRPPGYRVAVDRDEADAGRFERLAAQASTAPPAEAVRLLDQALALWRGPAYAGLADSDLARVEAIRLEEARLAAVERRAEALVGAGRAGDAVLDLEPSSPPSSCVSSHGRPSCGPCTRSVGRPTPSPSTRTIGGGWPRNWGWSPRRPSSASRPGSSGTSWPSRTRRPAWPRPAAGRRAGWLGCGPATRRPVGPRSPGGVTGDRPDLVVLPGWVSSLEVLASGRDPRSSLLDRLAAELALALYDRRGTGLSGGQVTDFGLGRQRPGAGRGGRGGALVGLLAMSQAGPVARPGRRAARPGGRAGAVRHLRFRPAVFSNPQLRRLLVDSIRTHWGIGSKVLADLYRPGASDEAAGHLARVLRQSVGPEVAAGYLEAVYRADVSALLPRVNAPTLVLHYRGDRLVPFAAVSSQPPPSPTRPWCRWTARLPPA